MFFATSQFKDIICKYTNMYILMITLHVYRLILYFKLTGVARLHTALDSIRNMPGNTILLDGGDQFQGKLWFNQYKGAAASHFMNRNGYDAMVRRP